MIRLGNQEFVTSSYTNLNACVEVGSDSPAAVQVADSKFNYRAGETKPVASFSADAFAAFVAFVRA